MSTKLVIRHQGEYVHAHLVMEERGQSIAPARLLCVVHESMFYGPLGRQRWYTWKRLMMNHYRELVEIGGIPTMQHSIQIERDLLAPQERAS